MLVSNFKRWCLPLAGCVLCAASAFAQGPALSAPTNGATGVAVPVTLSWNSVFAGATYDLQISTNSTFSTTVVSSTGLTAFSSVVAGLKASTKYYWKAGDVFFGTEWSSVWNFTTSSGTTTGGTAPVLASPAAGATGLPTMVSFSWGSVAGATSYTLQFDSTLDFSTVITQKSNITTTSVSVSGFGQNTTYFWRGAAVVNGTTGAWSSVWWFTVGSVASTLPHDALANIPSFSLKNGVIAYSVTKTGPVAIAVYDLLGKEVYGFNRLQPAGSYSLALANTRLSAGQYVVRFSAGNFEKRELVQLTGNH
jgi:hypothetical protein